MVFPFRMQLHSLTRLEKLKLLNQVPDVRQLNAEREIRCNKVTESPGRVKCNFELSKSNCFRNEVQMVKEQMVRV